MIWTLIFLGILILGFVIHRLSKILRYKYGRWDDRVDIAETAESFTILIGVAGLIFCGLMSLCANVGADNRIAKNQIKYETLCKTYKLIQSDYEDISKVEVLEEIAKWNTKVQDEKYWSENPWTNWFYNQKVADSLQYIDILEIN